jgi:hypothetical protein
VKRPDSERRNGNRAGRRAGIIRRGGTALTPYKQAIFPHARAIKSALVRCGIGAMKHSTLNFSQVEHENEPESGTVRPRPCHHYSSLGSREVPYQPRRAMKIFITALVLVFVLASGTSMMALTDHSYTYLAQNGAYAAGNQKAPLLY